MTLVFALSLLFLWAVFHGALLLLPLPFNEQAADLDDQAGATPRQLKKIFWLFLKTQWVIFSAHQRASLWACYRTLRTFDPHSVCDIKAADDSNYACCIWVENRVTGERKYFLHLHGKRRAKHINQVSK